MDEERLAIAMWDFSWLVRRQGEEDEYADWDRVLDQLADRGYNCVRIDAFPHLVAAGPDGRRSERFRILPQTRHFMWGNHEPVVVEPRPALLEFVTKARDRGVKVALSSWFNANESGRFSSVVEPADYARVWRETLDLLDGEGLLGNVAWVDLCNEFPAPLGTPPNSYRRIFGSDPPNVIPLVRRWEQGRRRFVASFMDEAISPLRAAHPSLRYTFSFLAWGASNVRAAAELASLDVVDAHVWLTDSPAFAWRSGFAMRVGLIMLPWVMSPRRASAVHAPVARRAYGRDKRGWQRVLSERMDVWAEWAKANDVPLYTSEGWVSTLYGGAPVEAGWGWFKELSSEAVGMAVEKGWTGICSSNFTQPHFDGMWRDVGWHQTTTRSILSP